MGTQTRRNLRTRVDVPLARTARGLKIRIGAVGVLVLSGCTWGNQLAAPWVLAETPKGTEVHVEALIGGTSCTELLRWHVTETEEQVEIRPVLRRTDAGDCTDDIGSEVHVVRLEDPLGQRDLTGCSGNDPNMAHVPASDPERDCRDSMVGT